MQERILILKMPDPFHLLVLVMCSLAFFILGAYVVGGIIATSVTLADQPASWVSAIATVMAAIGTVSTLIFLSYQHMLDKRSKDEEATTKLSQEALNAHISAIDSLLGYLYNEALGKDRKFAFLKPTYLNLVALEKKITVQNHRDQAQAKFEELHVHLNIFYFELTAGDLFTVDNDETSNISLIPYGKTWSSSADILVKIWLKNVPPIFGTIKGRDFTKYGWQQQMIKDEYLYFLLALLLSSSIELIDNKSVTRCIAILGKSHETCRVEINEKWFLKAVDDYPILTAHLFLRSSGFVGVKTASKLNSYEPKFTAYGPQNTWVCIDYNGGKANLTLNIPPSLNDDKYFDRIEKGEKIPNAGPIRMSF